MVLGKSNIANLIELEESETKRRMKGLEFITPSQETTMKIITLDGNLLWQVMIKNLKGITDLPLLK